MRAMASRLVVLCNSAAGLEEEFNRWYDEVHLPQSVHLLPGVYSGRKFTHVHVEGVADGPYAYLVIYEIADDLLEATIAQFLENRRLRVEAAAAGVESELAVSPAMDTVSLLGFFTSDREPVTKTIVGS